MRNLLIPFLIFSSCVLRAQEDSYFQQEVDYKMAVTLDDQTHRLQGTLELTYKNQSPDTLKFLLFHLWANAFQDNTSAFAQQQLRYNQTSYYFSPNSERGGYEQIDFLHDQTKLQWSFWQGHKDIAQIDLPSGLLPSQEIKIQIPFQLKIPSSFSRLGHVETSYQMTQWYPKPAVYDQEGWHPMPYLDAGEFYSEFGTYEVAITLPSNYLVAATGTLESPEEQDFLNKKVLECNRAIQSIQIPYFTPFPPSSTEMKTILYSAEQVHDFAWFADKRFLVQKSEVEIIPGKVVETWAFFPPEEVSLWREATNYLNRSLRFYSEQVGAYPYPQATAVQSALSAGAGMEYPMITIIGKEYTPTSLDEVITHEVGHNWFYGILATNERDHGWMDEGLNSYYERRYMDSYYPGISTSILPIVVETRPQASVPETIYRFQKGRGATQAVDTPSDELTPINYWHNYYDRPTLLLRHLKDYLGKATFDQAMQSFYQEWKFKHPQPNDLQTSFEASTGKDLAWFFEGLIQSKGWIDYSIISVTESDQSLQVKIENKGDIPSPFPIGVEQEEQGMYQEWIEGFEGIKSIELPNNQATHVRIDPERRILDNNRNNNHYHLKKIFPKLEPLQINLSPKWENGAKTQLGISPVLGWNNYDKWMPGIALHNIGLPAKPVEFIFMPMFSTNQDEWVGMGQMKLSGFFEKGAFEKWSLQLAGRQFHYLQRSRLDYSLRYQQFRPQFQLDFRAGPTRMQHHQLAIEANWINQETARLNQDGFLGTDNNRIRIHSLKYTWKDYSILNRFQWETALQHFHYNNPFDVEQYLQLRSSFKSSIAYKDNRKVYLRAFAGMALASSKDPGINLLAQAFDLTAQGWNDFALEHNYFGRSDRSGFWNQQITLDEGGFKQAFGPGQRTGRSNNFLISFNLMADLPFGIEESFPIRPYFDLAYADNGSRNSSNISFDDPFFFSGGLALELWHDRIAIYLPLVNSRNINDTYLSIDEAYSRRISFTFNLKGIEMKDLLTRFY